MLFSMLNRCQNFDVEINIEICKKMSKSIQHCIDVEKSTVPAGMKLYPVYWIFTSQMFINIGYVQAPCPILSPACASMQINSRIKIKRKQAFHHGSTLWIGIQVMNVLHLCNEKNIFYLLKDGKFHSTWRKFNITRK